MDVVGRRSFTRGAVSFEARARRDLAAQVFDSDGKAVGDVVQLEGDFTEAQTQTVIDILLEVAQLRFLGDAESEAQKADMVGALGDPGHERYGRPVIDDEHQAAQDDINREQTDKGEAYLPFGQPRSPMERYTFRHLKDEINGLKEIQEQARDI